MNLTTLQGSGLWMADHSPSNCAGSSTLLGDLEEGGSIFWTYRLEGACSISELEEP